MQTVLSRAAAHRATCLLANVRPAYLHARLSSSATLTGVPVLKTSSNQARSTAGRATVRCMAAAAAASSVWDFQVKDIDGKNVDLKKYKGKVVLVVNVASQCGFTPQYM